MIDKLDESVDRARFITHTLNYWEAISAGDSKTANKHSGMADDVVHGWAELGKAVDFLLPLLDHDSAAVQCAAATALLRYPYNEKAIQVLQRLRSAPVGLIGSAAEVALIAHRRSV